MSKTRKLLDSIMNDKESQEILGAIINANGIHKLAQVASPGGAYGPAGAPVEEQPVRDFETQPPQAEQAARAGVGYNGVVGDNQPHPKMVPLLKGLHDWRTQIVKHDIPYEEKGYTDYSRAADWFNRHAEVRPELKKYADKYAKMASDEMNHKLTLATIRDDLVTLSEEITRGT